MGETDRNEDAPRTPEEPEIEPESDDPPRSVASSSEEGRLADGEVADVGELLLRFRAREPYVAELHDELAAARLAADEARARIEASGTRVQDLEGERDRLRGRVRELEEEERRRGRRREGQDRQVARLRRELERRDAEIGRLKDGMQSERGEMEAQGRENAEAVARKDAALEEALRRVEGLERDLEERETEVVELRTTVDRLRAEIDLEHELRRRMAEPANRLRAGVELFNDSEHPRSVDSISKSLGQPEVHVETGEGGAIGPWSSPSPGRTSPARPTTPTPVSTSRSPASTSPTPSKTSPAWSANPLTPASAPTERWCWGFSWSALQPVGFLVCGRRLPDSYTLLPVANPEGYRPSPSVSSASLMADR